MAAARDIHVQQCRPKSELGALHHVAGGANGSLPGRSRALVNSDVLRKSGANVGHCIGDALRARGSQTMLLRGLLAGWPRQSARG